VKTILSKPASSASATDVEVRQLQATGKRIAADKKSIIRFLAATGMYTAAGRLKPQFR
jgi:predicted deacylase